MVIRLWQLLYQNIKNNKIEIIFDFLEIIHNNNMDHYRMTCDAVASGNFHANGMHTNSDGSHLYYHNYNHNTDGIRPMYKMKESTKKAIITVSIVIGCVAGGGVGIIGGPPGIAIGVVGGGLFGGFIAAIIVHDM